MLLLYVGGLVFGQDLRPEVIHAGLQSDGSGSLLTVTCQHDHSSDAGCVEAADHFRYLGPQRVIDTDGRREYAAQGKIEMGVAGIQAVEGFPVFGKDHCAFVLEDEMTAAYDGPFAADPGGNAVGHDIFHLAVHFLMVQVMFPG